MGTIFLAALSISLGHLSARQESPRPNRTDQHPFPQTHPQQVSPQKHLSLRRQRPNIRELKGLPKGPRVPPLAPPFRQKHLPLRHQRPHPEELKGLPQKDRECPHSPHRSVKKAPAPAKDPRSVPAVPAVLALRSPHPTQDRAPNGFLLPTTVQKYKLRGRRKNMTTRIPIISIMAITLLFASGLQTNAQTKNAASPVKEVAIPVNYQRRSWTVLVAS